MKPAPKSPSTVHWIFSGKCNLRCDFCYGPFSTGKLSLEKKLLILKKLADAKIKELTITGGEPLIDKDVFDVIQKAKTLGLKTSLHTNATFLDRTARKRLLNHLSRLSLGLDASTAELCDRLRGRQGYFLQTKRCMNWAVKNHVPLTVKTIVSRQNIFDLPKLAALLTDYLSKSQHNIWYLSQFTPLRGGKLNTPKHSISKSQFARVKIELSNSLLPIIFASREQIERKPYFFISPTGKVFCWSQSLSRDVMVGDIFEASIQALWRKVTSIQAPSNRE